MNTKRIFIAALALSCAAAQAIVPGVLTTQWPWVAKIGPSTSNLNTTATAVGDHWVLTARHVVSGNPQMQFVLDNGTRYDSVAIFPHPTDDIALVQFAESFPGWYRLHFNQPAQGSLMEIVGYGRTGTFNGSTWAWVVEYGNKRRGRNTYSTTMVLTTGQILGTYMVADFDGNGVDTYGDGGPVTDEATFGAGDSGGPALIQESGEWKVAGVNVFIGAVQGGPNAPQYGSILGSARVSTYRPWIDSIMPREVRPTTLTPVRWNLVNGNLASLFMPDDNRITAQPAIVFTTAQAPVEFIISATSPTLTTTRLAFAYEGSASSSGIHAKIELFNFSSGAYETVSNQACTTADSIIETVITSNPDRFIQDNTGEVRTRISARAMAPVFSLPWNYRVDRAVWNIKIP
ncbi:MAG: trypsin-like serine protease [Armatimonadota bacterium]|nr:trypsin-like serine protease [Armatimonadota bacterium]